MLRKIIYFCIISLLFQTIPLRFISRKYPKLLLSHFVLVLPIVKLNAAGQPLNHQPLMPPMVTTNETAPMGSVKQEPPEPVSDRLDTPIGTEVEVKIEDQLIPSTVGDLASAYGVSVPPSESVNGDAAGVAETSCNSFKLETNSAPSEQQQLLQPDGNALLPKIELHVSEDDVTKSEDDIVIKTDDDNTLLNQVDETGLPKVIDFFFYATHHFLLFINPFFFC